MFASIRFIPLSSCLLSRNVKVKTYNTTILLVVLYGCETWSLTLREEHRLRVFENRVLRRRRDEVTGEWRKLHTTILPVVLYGCETWSLTLREEHRLRVFENRVLRRIFGLRRGEVTGEWRKLHNEELYNFYFSSNQGG
jgi:hypothetical protein